MVTGTNNNPIFISFNLEGLNDKRIVFARVDTGYDGFATVSESEAISLGLVNTDIHYSYILANNESSEFNVYAGIAELGNERSWIPVDVISQQPYPLVGLKFLEVFNLEFSISKKVF